MRVTNGAGCLRAVLGVAVAAAVLLVSWFFVVPRVADLLILRPIGDPKATGAFGCATDDGGPPTTGLDSNGNGAGGHAVSTSVATVQTGTLPGFDRVIVYVHGEVPHHSVGGQRRPTFPGSGQSGDSLDFTLRGRYGLTVFMTWGESETYLYDRTVHAFGASVAEGRLVDMGDQISMLALGLSRAAPFRVSTVGNPSRLVVDLATGPTTCESSWLSRG